MTDDEKRKERKHCEAVASSLQTAHRDEHPAYYVHRIKTLADLIERERAEAREEHVVAVTLRGATLRERAEEAEHEVACLQSFMAGAVEPLDEARTRAEKAEAALKANEATNAELSHAYHAAHKARFEAEAACAAIRGVVEAFVAAVDDSVRARQRRAAGGQQVPDHSEFCSAPPSTLCTLDGWRMRFESTISPDAGQGWTSPEDAAKLWAVADAARAVYEEDDAFTAACCDDGRTDRDNRLGAALAALSSVKP